MGKLTAQQRHVTFEDLIIMKHWSLSNITGKRWLITDSHDQNCHVKIALKRQKRRHVYVNGGEEDNVYVN